MSIEEKKIKALHLASFSGNTGDVANHAGFYSKLKERDFLIEWTPLEIRTFYKNRKERRFDDSFIELLNGYDVLVLGGGGFFDLKWDYSHTGTTIDLSLDMLEKINIPVWVNAMGYHEYEETTEEHVDKFRKFLEIITKKDNWFVSLRNDGSYERMEKRYKSLMKSVVKAPDAGFFFHPGIYDRLGLSDTGTTWVGMNITNELFSEQFNKEVSSNDFNTIITEYINDFLDKRQDCNIIFFPHTNHDISVVNIVMNNVNDKYKRERIVIAPLVSGGKSVEYVYDLYRICACIIGMRFHTNVCAIGMNIPSIGLAGHEQIVGLYNELDFPDRTVKVDAKDFDKDLCILVNQTLDNSAEIKKQYTVAIEKLNNESDNYIGKISEWITRANLEKVPNTVL